MAPVTARWCGWLSCGRGAALPGVHGAPAGVPWRHEAMTGAGRGSVAHVYEDDGSYIVTATVLDAAGRRHSSSIGIVVAED